VTSRAGLDAAEERQANTEEEWTLVVKEAKVHRGLQRKGVHVVTSEGLKKVLKLPGVSPAQICTTEDR
jgi:hypothetical protein